MTPTTTERREAITIELPTYGPTEPSNWIDIDWSQHLRRAMVGGRSVNYVDYGDPSMPAVVLVHGLAGCWQNWIANIVRLSADFRVIALDLPGFGASEMPAEPISIPLYANTVAGLLDHLELADADVIGNSMGGMTTLQLTLDHPSRVRSIVLVSPAGWSTCETPEILGDLGRFAGLIMGGAGANREALARRPRLRAQAFRGVIAHPDRLPVELIYELLGGPGTDGFAPALKAILGHDFRPRLGEIEAPAMFIWGRRDGLVSSRDIVRFGEAIPHAKLIALRDTAHVAMVEHPEWFDRTVADFLLER